METFRGKVSDGRGPVSDSLGDLDDFFENGAVGLHIVSGDGTILRANKAELAMLGYTSDEYVGRHIANFHADSAAIADILTRLKAGERLESYPARLSAKDGSIRHVLITSSGLFRDGQLVQTRCFTVDVTHSYQADQLLREGERRFQEILQALPTAVYTTDAQGKITFYNQAAADLAGREPVVGSDEWCVCWRLYRSDGSPLPLDQCPMAVTLKHQERIRGVELIAERPDGSRARVVPYPTPLFDAGGRVTGAVNMLVDITDRHAAERETARLAAIVRSSQDAIICTTTDGQITFWSRGAADAYGYQPEEMEGQSILRVIPPELHDEELRIQQRIRRGERIEYYETERLAKNGKHVSISLSVSVIRDQLGNVLGVARVGRDITERKHAERVQNLLMGELNHRVKNTLATVQSIAHQTLRTQENPASFADSFNGRLRSLASASSLLADNSWQAADFSTLVRDQLLLGSLDDSRISYSGPAVVLDPQLALHVALVLHELGTNARKYGALSVPVGQVSIGWSVRNSGDRSLLLEWSERGGPPVVASKRGFGMTLIENSLKSHGGTVAMDFQVNGITCKIKLPLGEVTQPRKGAYSGVTSNAALHGAGQSELRGKRILIVEDEPLVAMDMISALEEHGCETIGPAADVDSGMELVARGNFDAALLDANLRGQAVDGLAAELTRINIPFAFVSGYGRENLPQAFRHAPLIGKPYTPSQLFAVLAQLLNRETSITPIRRKTS